MHSIAYSIAAQVSAPFILPRSSLSYRISEQEATFTENTDFLIFFYLQMRKLWKGGNRVLVWTVFSDEVKESNSGY